MHRQCKRMQGRRTLLQRKIIIHKSEVESITSHRGVDNCRSTTKGDGDGVAWSGSKEKTHNPR
jgi:hypothetical protein